MTGIALVPVEVLSTDPSLVLWAEVERKWDGKGKGDGEPFRQMPDFDDWFGAPYQGFRV